MSLESRLKRVKHAIFLFVSFGYVILMFFLHHDKYDGVLDLIFFVLFIGLIVIPWVVFLKHKVRYYE